MTWALCALFLSLALFWLSTRQWPTLARLAIWAAGFAALVAAAALLLAEQNHFGFFRAIVDAIAHWDNLDESVLAQALERNFPTVAGFVLQLLDIFVLICVVLGVVALGALTPGERVERALRPTIFIVAGFILGAVTALSVAAVGFGGQMRPRAYVGEISDKDIRDGDTFWIGEAPLRLWGADAPELKQVCGSARDCGERARKEFADIVAGAIVRCDARTSSSGRVTESFGRPLVRCFARREGEREFDVAAELIRRGFAVPYENDPSYDYDDEAAQGQGRGVMTVCSLRPDVWRRDRRARRAYETDQSTGGAATMGACSS